MTLNLNSRLARTIAPQTLATTLLAGGLVLMAVPNALATPNVLSAFAARYPTSTILTRVDAATGSSCYACHHPSSYANKGNCYRRDLLAKLNTGMTEAQAIDELDGVDSDGDGVPNGVEITMPRSDIAGAIGYDPGLVGVDGTDPCATNTSTAVTHQLETPPPPCPADLDNGTGAGTPDGGVDINDLLYFLGAFEAGAPAADLDNGTGSGSPDGGIDINDLLFFLQHFAAGC